MSSAQARLIRRYSNRKLYDTGRKTYVTLEELARLVRAGHDLRVEDNETGEDVTAGTLAKVLMNERPEESVTRNVLHELVRWGGRLRESTLEQAEQRWDQLVEGALSRAAPVREMRENMSRLSRRVAELEAAVAELAQDPADAARPAHTGRSAGARPPGGPAGESPASTSPERRENQ